MVCRSAPQHLVSFLVSQLSPNTNDYILQVGEILGLWVAGTIAQRFGYKKTILGAHIMMIAFVCGYHSPSHSWNVGVYWTVLIFRGADIPHLLRKEYRNALRGLYTLWAAMGSIPNFDNHVCRRDQPFPITTVFDHIRQYVCKYPDDYRLKDGFV